VLQGICSDISCSFTLNRCAFLRVAIAQGVQGGDCSSCWGQWLKLSTERREALPTIQIAAARWVPHPRRGCTCGAGPGCVGPPALQGGTGGAGPGCIDSGRAAGRTRSGSAGHSSGLPDSRAHRRLRWRASATCSDTPAKFAIRGLLLSPKLEDIWGNGGFCDEECSVDSVKREALRGLAPSLAGVSELPPGLRRAPLRRPV